MGLSAAGHCATDHRLGLQRHVSRCLQLFARAHTRRSILSKGVTLFQISSNTKKPKRKRDDTVLGRFQSTVRKFVFQDGDNDARNSGGKTSATVPSACASSFRVTFYLFFQPSQFVPRKIYDDPAIAAPSSARHRGNIARDFFIIYCSAHSRHCCPLPRGAAATRRLCKRVCKQCPCAWCPSRCCDIRSTSPAERRGA
jgi:hypothetical protein